MHWIIQNNLFHETGIVNLIETLDRMGISRTLHKVIPFVGEIVPDIDIDGNVMVMGSYSLRHVAKRKGWVPGVFDLEPFTYAVCVEHWGEHMLNHDSIFCSFGDSPSHVEGEMFIRPVADSKFFAGTMTDAKSLKDWVETVVELDKEGHCDPHNLNPSTMVMMASPKTIYAEYRTWIVDGKVVTASLYKRGGRVIYDGRVDDEIISFANERAREWSPLRAYVFDVGVTDDGLKIIEINCANSCGLYSMDVGKIIEAIESTKF